ncbi:MAG: DNA-binding domain-containing protein [Oricola sp.]
MQSAPDTNDLDVAGFRSAVFDPARYKPAEITGPHGKKAVRRFNVYRNNVVLGLVNVLVDYFPATARITGDNFFRAMAREFVRAHPPSSPLLFLYGTGFPAFIESFAPAASMPYLADVARVERAWLTAYHAADLEPLAPAALGAVPPDRLAEAVFAPHPATGLVRSPYAVFEIYDANCNAQTVGPIEIGRPQSVLVTRPGLDVEVTALPDGDDAFFESLIAGATLGEAAEAGLRAADGFDIDNAIRGLLQTGAFAAVATG